MRLRRRTLAASWLRAVYRNGDSSRRGGIALACDGHDEHGGLACFLLHVSQLFGSALLGLAPAARFGTEHHSKPLQLRARYILPYTVLAKGAFILGASARTCAINSPPRAFISAQFHSYLDTHHC